MRQLVGLFCLIVGVTSLCNLPTGTLPKECGRSPAVPSQRHGVDGRIVGGTLVDHLKYPWFASLHIPGDVSAQVCAGTLITSRHVLSAAHCFAFENLLVSKESLYEVTVGLYNFCSENPGTETFSMLKVFVHSKFTDPSHFNDISMIALSGTSKFEPICMPVPKEPIRHSSRAHIYGFGALHFNKTSEPMPCEMNEAIVKIYTYDECMFSDIPSTLMDQIRQKQQAFCAGELNGGIDTCQGDSGGSLSIIRNKKYVMKGIVSFGYGCASKNLPGVYTNVAMYIDWIEGKLAQACEYTLENIIYNSLYG